MSKAVLIMEMPKRCSDCQLLSADYGCAIIGATGGSHGSRSEYCPLKSLPELMTENYRSEFARGIKKGWNDVLKEIIG